MSESTDPQRHTTWKHPFVLALIPAITAVTIAVINIRSSSPDPEPVPVTAAKSAVHVSHRIEKDFDAYDDGWSVAFAGPLPSTAQRPVNARYPALLQWAAARGAIDVTDSHLRLFLQNDGTERVTIRAIRAKVVERLAPVTETFLKAPSAGSNELIELLFDLDRDDVIAASTPISIPSSPTTALESFFSGNDITLDPGETIDMKLGVSTRTCFCRYRFELEIVRADSNVILDIGDDAGRPFEITALSNTYVNQYLDGGLACSKDGFVRMESASEVDCGATV